MTTEALSGMHALSGRMQDALKLPSGARFYRCALQINPFAYLKRYGKMTRFASEEAYNRAIIEACLANNIEVIAVTDHYRVEDSVRLVHAAREEKLHAFSGFEAVAKDGVHFLCLFDPDKDEHLERFIGACGICGTDQLSPIGDKDSTELLELAKDWDSACIAAHVASKGGLLKTLSGQSRVNVWTHSDLLACALSGPVDEAPEGVRPILKNRNLEHRRDRPVAILNAADVNDPEDLKKPGASCFIKMSTVSIEAFRQAFLDPDSRVRLLSEQRPEPHAEFVAMTWEGGFLRDTAVHFNKHLNVLTGGRGAGKYTMIESIRYVLGLDPLGEEARKIHEGMVHHVLQPGTKASLRVRSRTPSPRCYTIERSVPNPPVVKDEEGRVLALSPHDVMPGVAVFGQHEISELTKSPEKLTLLLERFVKQDSTLLERKSRVRLDLERSRNRIMRTRQELQHLDERLAELPSLEEMQKRFQQAGLEDRLKEKSLLVREERLFVNLDERIEQYRTLHRELTTALPVDTAFVTRKAVEGLPNADLLSEIEEILGTLSTKLETLSEQFGEVLAEADRAIAQTKSRWNGHKIAIEETYEKLLRELQKSKIDGAKFIRLRQQIETLRPLRERMQRLRSNLQAYETERRNLLAEWEDIKASEYRQLETTAKQVSRKLSNKVQIKVAMAGNHDPLEQLLREEIGGNLRRALEHLRKSGPLSLPDLARRCREGQEALRQKYGLPPAAAERIAQADPNLFMRIEELELPAITQISLNTAPDGKPHYWQTLEKLSTGQKATAILLLLLLESESPLVVDQPEDDLDNRFITESVMPILRREKQRRQFVFSTHNANIPVLGDAELILGLTPTGEAGKGQAQIKPEHMAAIDHEPVRELVENILEGGKAAFEMRRSKYGF